MVDLATHIRRWLDHDLAATVSVGAGVVIALVWSSASASSYQHVFDSSWSNHFARWAALDSVHAIVTDALLTIFFFAIGLELSRELRQGTLATTSSAVPPVLGAIGGMAVTALLSVLVGTLAHSNALRRGWGVPMATDIAFTLGVLALAGRRLPPQVRIFLLTLAVADDVFSVAILSLSGPHTPRVAGLLAVTVALAVAVATSRRARPVSWSLAFLVLLWACFVWANIEPPLAGVVAGLFVTFDQPSGIRLESTMGRWSIALVLPLFALVSCGVRWHQLSLRSGTMTIVVSMVAIRIIGKVVGICGGVSIARVFRCRLDAAITWPLLASVSVLCAIGITVPMLFAGNLFGVTSATYGAYTVGLISASLVATVVGVFLVQLVVRHDGAKGSRKTQ